MNKPIRKKLIEVALPLEAINEASAREKSIRHGHPSTLHLWWARRPLAAARAVIFAQMVDDPSSWPDLFTTEKAQEKERQRLFGIIEELVQWENTNNDAVLQRARDEVWRSWRRACAENVDHPNAKALFDRDNLPAFHDPFAGGGALPLEAQRLGLVPFASDLNPVAVLINKAMIEIPPKFAGRAPVNPNRNSNLELNSWTHAQGIAEDVSYYGRWMREEALRRIGHLYPEITVSEQMAEVQPELKPLIGKSLRVMAWLWARTVKSPNPAFRDVEVPLASSFLLSAKPGKEAFVEPIVEGGSYRFVVHNRKAKDVEAVKSGTKLSRGSFRCLLSDTPIPYEYVDAQANAGKMGDRLLAVVVESDSGRLYLSPSPAIEAVARTAEPVWKPDAPSRGTWASNAQGRPYGFKTFGDYFTPRQLVVLTTLSDIAQESRHTIKADALKAGMKDDGLPLTEGGQAATAYADAIALYLAFLVNQVANHSSSLCGWNSANAQMRSVFARQAIAMSWDYAECNPFSDSSGSFNNLIERQVKGFEALGIGEAGFALAADANTQEISKNKLVSTDPPYYDNIGYADLSDFFYVWLRRALRPVFPALFATLAVPKAEELVACSYRHGSKEKAEHFFLDGMTQAMHRIAEQAHPAFPVTIYYAFKQSEGELDSGTTSTGWETFLEAVIQAGFATTGTWPIRTEKQGRVIGNDANALASSIVIVCRRRTLTAPPATRRDFLTALQRELPSAIANLQRGNVAPVDLQQAAIGPGMAIFTRYSRVIDQDGNALSVREALSLINQALDEVLAHQEGDFDGDTRWALAWFEQFGFAEGDYGIAETLSKAKNTSVEGIRQAGIGTHGKGKVRLFRPEELPSDWSPESDKRLTVWDMVHHLIRTLEQGEEAAGRLLSKLGTQADTAKELAYRLYSMCERKKRSADALRYNALVSSWPELVRLAQQAPRQEQGPQQSFEGMN